MVRLLVDGIFFQLASSGIARVWKTILPDIAAAKGIKVFLLDRGNAPSIPGITVIPFPSYTANYTAADSLLVQQICDHFAIDVFTTTYYSTPTRTPMALMVYDMIPELFGFDMSARDWQEKEVAISYALRYQCISESTRSDLLSIYPEIAPQHAVVALCGVSEDIFREHGNEEISAFTEAFLPSGRPYFLFVGSRVQHTGYKNSRLFFTALESLSSGEFDILCVGGEVEVETEIRSRLPAGVGISRVELSDAQLACAYSGAIALIYISLYEGFGMPVVEAMACGCPVITTPNGSLKEVAGDAALYVTGTSVDELSDALRAVQLPHVRQSLRAAGLKQSQRFRWRQMSSQVLRHVRELASDSARDEHREFLARWHELRTLQNAVDI